MYRLARHASRLSRGLLSTIGQVLEETGTRAVAVATASTAQARAPFLASIPTGPSRCFAAVPSMASVSDGHIAPHGNVLVDLMVESEAEKKTLLAECQGRKISCSDRNACDVELLSVGGFSPLTGFMNKEEYDYCVSDMRLKGSDLLFGIPVVMDTNEESFKEGMKVELTYNGQTIGVMEINSKWVPNKPLEALKCYGTSSLEHPGVQMISMERGKYYIGGKVWGFELPKRVFPCATPAQVRADLPENADVVAFQCRNPIHRAHYELFTRALHAENVSSNAVCLVHPTCGPTQDDDIPGIVRYHTYEVLKQEIQNPAIKMAYLPYSMHMAGPREAIQHMIIRKNYGCTHFIIGRDMAGSKSSITGEDFYGAYDAQVFCEMGQMELNPDNNVDHRSGCTCVPLQTDFNFLQQMHPDILPDMAKKYAAELGMQTVPSLNVVYTEEKGYVTADVAEKEGLHVKKLSGTKFRKMLRGGEEIPEWFAFKSVVQVLREHTKAD